MNNKVKSVAKNIYYTVAANFATMLISMGLNLFIPKLLGIREYSYWQLYVFYSSYVGFLHLGWIDGIYLKIGGEEYDNLEKENLGSQFWYLGIFELIVAFLISIYSLTANVNSRQSFILLMVSVVAVITIAKQFIIYIFQSTNRIREYASLSRNDRYIYLFLLCIYFFWGGRSFYWLVFFDILSKFIITLWGMFRIGDIVFTKITPLRKMAKEIIDNIVVGSKLMLSNVASTLITGTIRFFIQTQWSIEVFGQLSFTLNISNMFLTFVNAVGIVMFPLLRRTNQANLPSLFITIRNLFVPVTYLFLLSYVPLKTILIAWLPQYSTSMMYMGVLFPIVIYEGRMSLLMNTYFKTLRMEKSLMLINLFSLLCSALLGIVSVFFFKNLLSAVILISFCLALRCNLSEFILSRHLDLKLTAKVLQESLLSIIFIACNIYFKNYMVSFIIYTFFYFIFILFNYKCIKSSIIIFYGLLKS